MGLPILELIMNWIERMYELKGKDLYAQSGEGLILEYVFHHLYGFEKYFIDIGSGDRFILSNTRHLVNLGWDGLFMDRLNGCDVNVENILDHLPSLPDNNYLRRKAGLMSIDIDGNDYWILEKILTEWGKPLVIIAEFNACYTDSRTIKYNPDHVWAGDSYYGFTFEAGKKLAEKHGYKVIFQIANMNMIMVREDLIKVSIPPVTYQKNEYFKMSERTDWVFI